MANHIPTAADRARKDRRGLNRITHGHTRGKHASSEWTAWKGMRQRCYCPSNSRFALYGGRGISVCERWRNDFGAFLADMGPKPSPAHSLDRIDVDGDYEPANCRWATQKSQCRNQRRSRLVSFNGEQMTTAELSERVGIESSHLRYHLNRGRSPEQAVAFIRANRSA